MLRPPQAELTVPQRLGVLRGALEGLAYAHRNGIVHGSVSPRTILIEEDGTPKLVEFAAWPGHPDAAGIGAYASPEAFAGEDLSPASDVYSVGALLSEIALDPAAAVTDRKRQPLATTYNRSWTGRWPSSRATGTRTPRPCSTIWTEPPGAVSDRVVDHRGIGQDDDVTRKITTNLPGLTGSVPTPLPPRRAGRPSRPGPR